MAASGAASSAKRSALGTAYFSSRRQIRRRPSLGRANWSMESAHSLACGYPGNTIGTPPLGSTTVTSSDSMR